MYKKIISLKFILIIFSIILFVFLISSKNSELDLIDIQKEIHLSSGKNYLIFNQSILASDLIKKNPQIQVISYFDEVKNKSVGYVNIFGGIGTDFLIDQEKIYQIFVDTETIIKIM